MIVFMAVERSFGWPGVSFTWNGFADEPSSWESAGERADGESFTVAGVVEVWVGMRVFSWSC